MSLLRFLPDGAATALAGPATPPPPAQQPLLEGEPAPEVEGEAPPETPETPDEKAAAPPTPAQLRAEAIAQLKALPEDDPLAVELREALGIKPEQSTEEESKSYVAHGEQLVAQATRSYQEGTQQRQQRIERYAKAESERIQEATRKLLKQARESTSDDLPDTADLLKPEALAASIRFQTTAAETGAEEAMSDLVSGTVVKAAFSHPASAYLTAEDKSALVAAGGKPLGEWLAVWVNVLLDAALRSAPEEFTRKTKKDLEAQNRNEERVTKLMAALGSGQSQKGAAQGSRRTDAELLADPNTSVKTLEEILARQGAT